MPAYSFKARFELPIRAGLGKGGRPAAAVTPKRQTIREGYLRPDGTYWSKPTGGRRHSRPGEMTQLYVGMRTKSCRKIGEAPCTANKSVLIYIEKDTFSIAIEGKLLMAHAVNKFAQRDGFSDWQEMKEFWEKNHPAVSMFEGVLIEWEPLR